MAVAEPLDLLPLAESVADGSAIDWDAAEAGTSRDQRGVIRQLRILSELAALHRSQPDPEQTHDTTVGRGATAAAMGSWAQLELFERLGGGSFADVYRAWDRHLERDVALKLLRLDEALADPLTSRITAEGRLLAKVRHPNVVAVHGVAVHAGRVGLWMELVRGATLEERLKAQGSFSAREAALVGIDLCRALAAIHAAGLLHRDIKAQNVMREAGGRIVLMDLGTGRAIDRLSSDMAGTPLYLAPELFGGGTAGEGTDLYSLGVLLYHLVTGSFPVRAATVDELRAGHAKGTAVRLRDARADLPTPFVRVVERAIAADPERRYASAGALEADLVHALDEAASITVAADGGVPRRPVFAWAGWGALAAAAVLAFAFIGWPALSGRFGSGAAPIRSIAVLPLVNLSGDPAQDYFVDAMTEELIDNLARIGALRVISRTSVMQYKGSKKSLREVAAALNVDAILEGSVSKSGDRVRISADLVHVASDRHVWVESYERDVRNVLALQSEVARTIARQVRIQITPTELAGFGAGRQIEPTAQDAYFQGRYYWNKRTPDDLTTALQYFQRAVAIDPSFARAYAGQADAYNLLPRGLSPFTAYPLAKAAAARALDIDPTLDEAHTSLALVQFLFDRDDAAAEASFKRALQLNPGYATAHHWFGEYLAAMGRLDEATAQLDQARALDPLSASIRDAVGQAHCYARRYDQGIAELRAAVAIDAANAAIYRNLAWCYEAMGKLTEADAETRRGLELAPQFSFLLAEAGRLAALRGDRAEALRIAAVLTDRTDARVWPETIAFIHAALGDTDRAFEFLGRAVSARSQSVLWARVDPMFDSLRGDPRFVAMLRALRLAN